MSTLDDLRATLHGHVPPTDEALHERVASVRARVRVVRRRRRVGVVAGAVAAVALVVAGIALPRPGLDRADPVMPAATSVTYGGFDYELVKVVSGKPGQTEVEARIARGSRPVVVVLLAENLHGGSATLRLSGAVAGVGHGAVEGADGSADPADQPADRIVDDGAGFAVAIPEPADEEEADAVGARVRAVGAGDRVEVGLAIYRRTDAMPDGVVDATGASVFRRQVGGEQLVGAAFLDGRAEGSFTFTGRLADLRIGGYCGVPGGADEHTGPYFFFSVDGDGYSGGACDQPSVDAFSGGSRFTPAQDPGRHTVRFWTASTWDEGFTTTPAPAAVPDAVAGLAVYSAGDRVDIHGNDVARIVEFDGRLWQLADTIDSGSGTHRIVATWTNATERHLVGYAVEGTRRVDTGGSIGADGFTDRTAARVEDTRSSSLGGVVLPGTGRSTYTVTWPSRYADARGAILVYTPLG